jgi:AraC-like DNA-binding protein
MIYTDMPKEHIDRPDSRTGIDVLSDVISFLNPVGTFSAALTTGGDWAIRFPGYEGLKFNAVIRGTCWLSVDDVAEQFQLFAGDCYLLTTSASYRLASDLSLKPIDSRSVFAHPVGGNVQYGSHSEDMLIGGRIEYEKTHVSILLDTLPPLILIRAQSALASTIPWVLEQLAKEVSNAEPGATLMENHLAHILFIKVLRAHLASGNKLPPGWLGAFSDEKVALALTLMHHNPGRRWSLSYLASETGLSRSVLSLRFKKLVGRSPLDYLLHWRMQLATRKLLNKSEHLAEVASSLGYESETAFCSAFKRIIGKSPKRYQREASETKSLIDVS